MPPLNTEQGQKWLYREIETIKPDAIFFDSIMSLLTGDLMTPDAWQPRLDREAERAGDELFVSYNQLSDVFAAAPPELREHLFRLLLRTLTATHALGRHFAPDGRGAREAHSDQCGAKARAVEAAVRIYLEAHPDPHGPPKATTEYANAIRPAILDALSLPSSAKRPAVSAIKQAIGAVKRRTAL